MFLKIFVYTNLSPICHMITVLYFRHIYNKRRHNVAIILWQRWQVSSSFTQIAFSIQKCLEKSWKLKPNMSYDYIFGFEINLNVNVVATLQ